MGRDGWIRSRKVEGRRLPARAPCRAIVLLGDVVRKTRGNDAGDSCHARYIPSMRLSRQDISCVSPDLRYKLCVTRFAPT